AHHVRGIIPATLPRGQDQAAFSAGTVWPVLFGDTNHVTLSEGDRRWGAVDCWHLGMLREPVEIGRENQSPGSESEPPGRGFPLRLGVPRSVSQEAGRNGTRAGSTRTRAR